MHQFVEKRQKSYFQELSRLDEDYGRLPERVINEGTIKLAYYSVEARDASPACAVMYFRP